MSPKQTESRRQFIKKTSTVAAAVAGVSLFNLPVMAGQTSASVSIVLDVDSPLASEPPVRWAAEQLRDALTSQKATAQIYERLDQAPSSQECILVTGAGSKLVSQICEGRGIAVPNAAESFALARGRANDRSILLAAGSDSRGLVYALLELTEQVQFASDPIAALKDLKPVSEQPANAIRGIARAFVSDVEDKNWYNDRAFWSAYLTTLATQRFNRFHLMLGVGYDFTTNITDCYFHFAYPFLLTVPGYNVRAVPLPDSERDANLEMLRFISDEAARRGLHFQLGVWTHAYQWTNSPNANYLIEGLTPATHAPYCRDALRAVLVACPNIKGVTFRIHGESGVPEGNYDLWKTIFDGVTQCGRPMEIDMHAKGMDQDMINVALGTGLPVTIAPKSWAEHMGLPYMQGAIRPQEMPPHNARSTGFFSRSSGSRSFLRYGYGDLLAEDRRYRVFHRMWPGTQRLLAWGNLEMASAYGRVSSFCGCVGLELMEPLSFKGRKGSGLPGGRTAYSDTSLAPQYDFEKYLYSYRIWGRGLYNPDGDMDGKRRGLQKFNRGAESIQGALAAAGKILPLITTAHCPSAANNNYWPEMYFNMPIVDAKRQHPYSDTPSPKRLGTVTSLDPEFFLGMDEFADELLKDQISGKYSPAWVATQLDAAADSALAQLRRAKFRSHDAGGAEFRRLSLDTTLQAGLGKFFAAKFRAGTLFAIYSRTGNAGALKKAIAANRASRDAWAELAKTAKGIYRDDVTFGPEYFQRGHWLDRLPAMDADIADMEKLQSQTTAPSAPMSVDPKLIEQSIQVVLGWTPMESDRSLQVLHTPPQSFRRGESLPITMDINWYLIVPFRVDLRYRRVNQSENWQALELQQVGSTYSGPIPGEYSDSPFPLQYHFRIHASRNRVWVNPGLNPGWQGQPYYVVRQS